MATVVDELITKFTAQDNFTAASRKMTGALKGVEQAVSGLTGSAQAVFGALQTGALGVAAALTAVTAAGLAAGQYAVRRAMEFQSLTLALENVEGSAGAAERSLRRLREIARGPGLGVTEAIETYMGLRRGGLDGDMSMRLTQELGNMVARSGGGREVLGRAGLALSQISMTEFLQGDELRQLSDAGIPAYAIVKEMFGTADTEQLKKNGITSRQVLDALLDAMERMPRVAGGARNAWENLLDSVDQAVIQFGNAFLDSAAGISGALSTVIDDLSSAGVWTLVGKEVAANFKAGFIDPIVGSSTSATGALIELGAAVVGVSAFMRNLADVLRSGINMIGGSLTRFIETLNPILGLKIGDGKSGGDLIGRALTQQSSVVQEMNAFRDQAWANVLRARLLPSTEEDAPGKAATAPAQAPGVRTLEKIERNTRPLLDFQQFALGGGELGRAGVTATEIAGMKGSRGAGGKLEKAVAMIREAVIDDISRQLAQGRRLGVS